MDEAPQVPSEDSQWQYQQTDAPALAQPKETEVRWTASEFIAHEKSFGWYALFLIGAVVLTGLAYLFTRDKVSTGIVVVVAILFAVAAKRQPRVLDYTVNGHGLVIGAKLYPYMDFRSFSITQEGAFASITLTPLKRFMPPLSIYYEPKDEERIVQIIAAYLPHENHQQDLFDQLINRLHF